MKSQTPNWTEGTATTPSAAVNAWYTTIGYVVPSSIPRRLQMAPVQPNVLRGSVWNVAPVVQVMSPPVSVPVAPLENRVVTSEMNVPYAPRSVGPIVRSVPPRARRCSR